MDYAQVVSTGTTTDEQFKVLFNRSQENTSCPYPSIILNNTGRGFKDYLDLNFDRTWIYLLEWRQRHVIIPPFVVPSRWSGWF